VTWTAPLSDGGAAISDYTIETREVGTLTWVPVSHNASTSTTIQVSNLSTTATYVARVRAINSEGFGPWNITGSRIDGGREFACAVVDDGTIQCWGDNTFGQLGNGSKGVSAQSLVPVESSRSVITGVMAGTTAVSLSAGRYHACALMGDGTVKCWGLNYDGQVGDGSNAAELLTAVSVSGITGLTPEATAVDISAGSYHTCAAMANGTVRCWGHGQNGQLGDATTVSKSTPTVVAGITGLSADTTAMSVTAGALHSCAVMGDRSLKCWGHNNPGQLGFGGFSLDKSSPIVVVDLPGLVASNSVVSATGGLLFSCAQIADGTAKCWGSNAYGESGFDPTTASSSYSPLSAGATVITGLSQSSTSIDVSSGRTHSCALMADGTVTCWGNNLYGQLGNGDTTSSFVPVRAGASTISGVDAGSTAVEVAATDYFSCALMADDSVKCWGRNDKGQIGDGTSTNALSPMDVQLIVPITPPGVPGKPKIGKRTTSSIAIKWSAAASNGSAVTDHIVEYRTGAGAWLTFAHPQPITSTATTVTGLTKGVQYTFRVTAVSAAGAGAPSAVSKLALAASAPGAPQSLVAKPNGLRGQLVLSWKPAAINGAPTLAYSVKWLRAGKWVLSVKVKGALTYTIKGLPKGAPQTVCVTVKTIEGTARVIKAGIILK
jgi:alpha-tubulin suppressor-like RCC1 family protein